MKEKYCDNDYENFENSKGRKYYPQPYSLYFLLIFSFISFVLCTLAGGYSNPNIICMVLFLLILWTMLWSIVVFVVWTYSNGISWGLSFMAVVVIILCVVYLFI